MTHLPPISWTPESVAAPATDTAAGPRHALNHPDPAATLSPYAPGELRRFCEHFDEPTFLEAIEEPPAFLASPGAAYLESVVMHALKELAATVGERHVRAMAARALGFDQAAD